MTAIGGYDDISRELEAMSSQSEVEAELARLKGAQQPEAISGSAPSVGELGAGDDGSPEAMQAGSEKAADQPAPQATEDGGRS